MLFRSHGVSINREPYGPLTGTLVPPSMSNAVAIIEAMLAAEQGVKNVTVGYGQCGNLVQDVAALRVLEELTEEYLEKYGYEDVTVTSVLHQWMGGFPQDESKAFAVISWGSSVAALAKATKVIVKTPHEAMGVPTMEANAQGLRCTKQAISLLADQELKSSALELEKAIIKGETCAIVDKCFELGMGDLALGAIRAVKAGVLDIPFAPSKYNAGKMLIISSIRAGPGMLLREYSEICSVSPHSTLAYGNPLFTATCQADMAWCSGHRQRVTHHGRMPGDIPGVTITAIQRHILMGSWNAFCGKWQTTSNGSPLPLLISRFLRLQNL